MTPVIFVWPYALVFWSVYIWAFAPKFGIVMRARRADRASRASQDGQSMQVIILGMWIALAAAFPLAKIERFAFPPAARLPASWAGTVLVVACRLLTRRVRRVLPTHFPGTP